MCCCVAAFGVLYLIQILASIVAVAALAVLSWWSWSPLEVPGPVHDFVARDNDPVVAFSAGVFVASALVVVGLTLVQIARDVSGAGLSRYDECEKQPLLE